MHHPLLEWPSASDPSGALLLDGMKDLAFPKLESYNEDNINIETQNRSNDGKNNFDQLEWQ